METNTHYIEKNELREKAKAIRASLNIIEISKKICQKIKSADLFNENQHILGFYPFNSEIDIRELYLDTNKKWYLPRVKDFNSNLTIHEYTNEESLVQNKWGILEPSKELEEINPSIIDIAIIPALMVDTKGFRLGYGAGFYDKFINLLRDDCIKIVPISEKLIIEEIPVDKWDAKIDIIASETRIIKIK